MVCLFRLYAIVNPPAAWLSVAQALKHQLREQSAAWQSFPEAMLRICPGYRPADGDEPVARARRVKRRPRGAERTVQQSFPEAMLRICPGYQTLRGF